MPCCSAWGCSNRSEMGYRMFAIPRKSSNEKNLGGKSETKELVASSSSFLCEVIDV